MKNKYQRLSNQIQLLQQQQCLQVLPVIIDGLENKQKWVVWIKGKKNTVFQGGIYPLVIQFNQDYPKRPPTVSFDQQFQHIHVYEGGLICLPIVDQQYWKINRTMRQVLIRLQTFLHQQPNLHSPANSELLDIYLKDRQQYIKIMKRQAELYSKKNPKYFQQSCLHVYIN